MEKSSQKIADLAGMFEDVDIEVIENILEMCQGKVNKAAEVLLKMKEDSQAKPPEKIDERKGNVLSQDFLELDEEAEEKVEKSIPKHKTKKVYDDVVDINSEDYEYAAQMQKAIELSLENGKKLSKKEAEKNSKKREAEKNKPSKFKEFFKKKPSDEKKTKKNEVKEVITANQDEEIIQFIFSSNAFVRGESMKS